MDRFLAGIERRAFRIARIATNDDDEALDVVQDAMVALVRRYATRDAAEWGPLFHRILQSRIRDWYRRAQVRKRLQSWIWGHDHDSDQDDPVEAVADPITADLVQEVAHRRAAAALEEALHSLPLRQQQAFLLRAWEELDVAETARAMGCSEGSVKTHYSRALHTLRQRLGDHWP